MSIVNPRRPHPVLTPGSRPIGWSPALRTRAFRDLRRTVQLATILCAALCTPRAVTASTVQVIYDMTYAGNYYFQSDPIIWQQTLSCISNNSVSRTDQVTRQVSWNYQSGSVLAADWPGVKASLSSLEGFTIGTTYSSAVTYDYHANACHEYLLRVYPGYQKRRYLVKVNGNAVALINVFVLSGVAAERQDMSYVGPPQCPQCVCGPTPDGAVSAADCSPPVSDFPDHGSIAGPPEDGSGINPLGTVVLLLVLSAVGILSLRATSHRSG